MTKTAYQLSMLRAALLWLLGVICLAFVLAGCAPTLRGRTLNIGVASAGVADLVSTRRALDRGAVEANPLMGQGAVRQAVVKGIGVSGVIALANLIERRHPVLAHVVRGAVLVGWSLAAVHNERVRR